MPGETFTALIIPATGTPYTRSLPKDWLATMQRIIGGYVERIGHASDQPISVFVNGDGKVLGLPVNENVDALDALELMLIPGDYVVGNVVVTGEEYDTEEGLACVDVPGAVLDLVPHTTT